MANQIVYVTTDLEKVDEENQIISRKGLNDLMTKGWDIQSEEEQDGLTKVTLKREENAVAVRSTGGALSVASGPDRGTEALQSAFGAGEGPDPGQQLISAMEDVSRAVSAGGSHLGGGVTRCIPGVQMVTAEEVGMARDAGVHAGMMGWGPEQCPFPHDSRPWHLWMEGYKAAGKQLDHAAERDFSEFAYIRENGFDAYLEKHAEADPNTLLTRDEWSAYNQGWNACEEAALQEAEAKEAGQEDFEADVLCPYNAGPSYIFWLMGFKDAGGKIDIEQPQE